MKWMWVLLLLMPSAALAEVSDKMPSIAQILVQSVAVSVALFVAGWFRWWLGVVLSPVFVLLVVGTISLWNEVGMREALLNEQGWVYFGALALEDMLAGIAVAAGAILCYKRRSLNVMSQWTHKTGAPLS